MRIYRIKRVRREWTDADRALAARLLAANASNDDIALALGRPAGAVRAWLHHYCKVLQEPEAIVYPRVIVPHEDVPRWYALGWRFSCFDGSECVFEWRASGKARFIHQKNVSVDSGDKSAADQATRDLAIASLETEPA